MTANERVVATAARYIGVREKGTNTDYGGPIDQWQRYWGMGRGTSVGPVPWCGCFASGILRESDVTDVSNPSTAAICTNARMKGYETTTPVPGALIVWCGTHVEILVAPVRGAANTWATIGGNTADSVARRVRSLAGATIVVSPELRYGRHTPQRVYFLEDVKAVPKLYGPWRTRQQREKVIAGLAPGKRALARRVRVKGRYGFELGRRVYGPWLDEIGRQDAKAVLERRLGRQLRPFSRVRHEAGSQGAPDALGKTT